jgi:hypothetical protein
MYKGINKHCKRIYANIVNRKSTQYLVPREIGNEERQRDRYGVALESNLRNKLTKSDCCGCESGVKVVCL